MRSINRGGPKPSRLDAAMEAADREGGARVRPAAEALDAPADLPSRLRDRLGRFRGAPPKPMRAGAKDGNAAPVPPKKVGILFVNGIGSQEPGETIVSWSAPIVRAIGEWRDTLQPPPPDGLRHDRVTRTSIDFEGSTRPLVEIDIPAVTVGNKVHPRQRWVITEAAWSSNVEAPSIGVVLDWSTRQGVLGRVVEGIATNEAGSSAGIGRFLSRVGLASFLSLTSSVTALGYSVVRGIAAIVPIKELRDLAVFAAFEGFLMRWWGDVYLLLRDPVQSANVRNSIFKAAKALHEDGCDEIVIIAHSGGTIASYMTLDDPTYQLAAAAAGSVEARTIPNITKLITHGEAINLVRPLRPGTYDTAMSERPFDRIQPGLAWKGHWVDFWATHDPAPSGPMRPETAQERPKFRNVPIWNRRSIREDHGGYMENDEEFVLPLMRELDTPSGLPADSRFPDPCERANERRQRVQVLTMWRRLAFVAPFAALLSILGRGLADTGAGQLADVSRTAWTWVPGHERIAAAVSPLADLTWLVDLSALVSLATLGTIAALLAVHAALPIRQSGVWRRQPLAFATVVLLDWIPAAAVVLLLGWPLASGFIDGITSEGSDRRLLPIMALVVAMAIAVVAQITRSPGPPGSAPTRGQAIFSLVGLATVLVAISMTIIAFVAIEDLRVILVAAILAFLVYRPLVGYGARRWTRWDSSERSYARRHAPRPGRRFVFLEALALTALGIALAFGLASSSISLPGPIGSISAMLIAPIGLAIVATILSLTDASRVNG
jgi:hypothetical protein